MKNNVAIGLIAATALLIVVCIKQLHAEPKQFFEEKRGVPRKDLLERGIGFLNENPDSAVAYFTLASSGYDNSSLSKADREISATAQAYIGYVDFFYFDDYPGAYQALLTSNEIAEQDGLERIKCKNDINLANIYSLYSDFKAAGEMYYKAYEIAVKNRFWDLMMVAFINMVDAYYNEQNTTQPLKEVVAGIEKNPFPDTIPETQFTRNLVYAVRSIDNREYGKAIGFLNQARLAAKTTPQPERYRINADFLISRTYQNDGNYQGAIKALKEVLRDSTLSHNRDMEVKAYLRLKELYEKENIPDSADAYKLRYLELSDNFFNPRKITAVKDLAASHERQEFSNAISLLTARQTFQRRLMWVIIVVLVLTILMLVWIILRNRQLKERNNDLFNKNKELLKYYQEEARERKKKAEAANAESLPLKKSDDELYGKIMACMESDEIFSKDFNATRLASLCGTSSRSISAVLSEHSLSFPTLLSELRVREAMSRLGDTSGKYSRYTLEAIGESVGFKNRATFSTSFKKKTGLSPKDFRRMSLERVSTEK